MIKKNYSRLTSILHPDGYSIILVLFLLFIFSTMIHVTLAWFFAILLILCIYFFRNPDRVVPIDENIIISPGDGVIKSIDEAIPPVELGIDATMKRVTIILGPLDVYINRIPIKGVITNTYYNKGRFLRFSSDKSSNNERHSIIIDSKDSKTPKDSNDIPSGRVIVVQIAGIASGIICDVESGDVVSAGDRYGMIKFSSRIDLYLDPNIDIVIADGQTCIGGETIIGTKIKNQIPIVKEFKTI